MATIQAEESRKWSKISEILPTEKDTIGLNGKRERARPDYMV